MGEMLKEREVLTGQENGVLSRINGHFLFNTLETIRMMASVHEETEIEEVVKNLGRVLRGNVEVWQESVSLESELKLVESYLKIQDLRFGDRIRHEIKIECSLDGIYIPPLVIQPIVENAYTHGVEDKVGEEGVVSITVRKGETLQIIVEDNGVGMDEKELSSVLGQMQDSSDLDKTKVNLRSMHQKINLIYGKDYGITLQSAKMRGTKVVISLPA